MPTESIAHAGWKNNLQIRNEHAELIISLDVGPRVLSYRTPHGTNVFKNFPEQMGKSGEPGWMIRGGHRLWISPEHQVYSYLPDNDPVQHEILPPNGVRLTNAGAPAFNVRKDLTISLDEHSSKVTVHHKATNEGAEPLEIATWGLSVMAPGGMAIIPQPPLGSHPQDLLPNRLMVFWPYSDLSDTRYRFGRHFVTALQTANSFPTKFGLAHREKWVAYLSRDALFVKTFDYLEGEKYPDMGCNFELFTNGEMLEVESLSPLRSLLPGQHVEHTEHWYIVGAAARPHSLHEDELAAWINPVLTKLGIRES